MGNVVVTRENFDDLIADIDASPLFSVVCYQEGDDYPVAIGGKDDAVIWRKDALGKPGALKWATRSARRN